MKAILFGLFSLLVFGVFAQEVEEEFIPIEVEGKEAFMSTKTGEFTFLEHAKTDATKLQTTADGVLYTYITSHVIKKGETLTAVAKKNNVTIAELKKHNKVSSSNLKIGTSIKIVKKELIKSSSPVVSYAGEERIIAKLKPGESPGQFAAPPSVSEVERNVIETKKTVEKPAAPIYKAETSIKNPVFGLSDVKYNEEEDSIDDLSKAISKEVKESQKVKVPAAVIEKPVVVKKPSLKIESKKEKLARLKAEIKALKAELEEKTPVKENIEQDVSDVNSKSKEFRLVTDKKSDDIIKKAKNNRKLMVLEKKPKVSTAKKAKQVISSVQKMEKKVEASKIEVLKEDKLTAAKHNSDDNKIEANYYYTVKKGNSLWSIAKEHNMTIEAIKDKNNLKNNDLSIGQKLKVNPKKK